MGTDQMIDELALNASILLDAAQCAERLAEAPVTDREAAIEVRAILAEAGKSLTAAHGALDTAIGQDIGPDPVFIAEKRWRRHPKMSNRAWDSEALLRDVLDTRSVDPETGEVKDETPIDKVKAVWPLAGYNARWGAIKERGLDPTEYCESEWRGWNLEQK